MILEAWPKRLLKLDPSGKRSADTTTTRSFCSKSANIKASTPYILVQTKEKKGTTWKLYQARRGEKESAALYFGKEYWGTLLYNFTGKADRSMTLS